jgi:hypothetical protein
MHPEQRRLIGRIQERDSGVDKGNNCVGLTKSSIDVGVKGVAGWMLGRKCVREVEEENFG